MGLVWGRLACAVIGLSITSTLVKKLTGLSGLEQLHTHRRTIAAVIAMAICVLAADHQLSLFEAGPIVRIALLSPLGAFAYLGTLYALWSASGRCPGAEAELLGILGAGLTSMRRTVGRSLSSSGT